MAAVIGASSDPSTRTSGAFSADVAARHHKIAIAQIFPPLAVSGGGGKVSEWVEG
jgi:hypothetical protein